MISLPIYYEQEFKTKKNKTHLVNDNFVNNAHYHLYNAVKKHYHSLIGEQRADLPTLTGPFKLHFKIYYKNPSCDASNIVHAMEKFALDGMQEHGVIINDNVQYHLSSSWEVAGQDKANSRCEIEITAL